MIETCSTRRMLVLIGILLAASCLILLLEEYVEENEFDSARFIEKVSSFHKADNAQTKLEQISTESIDCSRMEGLKLVDSCLKCSTFEVNALKSEHCRETGFYNKYFCPSNNQSVYRPCFSNLTPSHAKFRYFTVLSFLSAAGFSSFVFWRRSVLEKHAYTRLQSFIG